jgi:hypothetical protein
MYRYRIRARGKVAQVWIDAFENMAITKVVVPDGAAAVKPVRGSPYPGHVVGNVTGASQARCWKRVFCCGTRSVCWEYRIPGPGRLLFGNLTADRTSFAALAACLIAILCTYLTPPIITLGSPPIEAGLRTIGSGVPVVVAASYLLMAILTMLAGGTGDAVGHKRMLLFGLGAVIFGELASMFWLGTPGFNFADALLNLAQIVVTPMCVAIVSFAFVPGVRPFAYGVLFSTQAIAIGLSSALYSVLKPLGNGTIVFFIPVVLGFVGLG